MLTQHQLHLLQAKLYQHKHRPKPSLSLLALSTPNPQHSLQQLCTMIGAQSTLLDRLIDDSLQFVRIVGQLQRDYVIKVEQLQGEVEGRQCQIETLEEQIRGYERERKRMLESGELLDEEVHILRESVDSLHQSMIKETQLIKQQMQGAIHEGVVGEGSKQEQEQRRGDGEGTADLEQQIAELRDMLKCNELQMERTQNKLTWEQRKRQELEQALRNKQTLIAQLYCEIEELRDNIKQSLSYDKANLQFFQPPDQPDQIIEQVQQLPLSKMKLSQDVQNRALLSTLDRPAFTERQYLLTNSDRTIDVPVTVVKSQSIEMAELSVDRAVSKAHSKQSKIRKTINLDPYYCHYLLLSQSIKISENEQAFFNIDIKPYYKQIVVSKVPMTEWKEWITGKFRQLAAETDPSQRTMSNTDMQNCRVKSAINFFRL